MKFESASANDNSEPLLRLSDVTFDVVLSRVVSLALAGMDPVLLVVFVI
jgi:hypothetical protein